MTGFYLAVLVDDDVFTVFTLNIFLVRSLQRNIAVLRGCLAIHRNLTVCRFQGHVFLRCHGIRIRTVITDMDVALARLHRYAAVFRSYSFHNVHVTCSNIDGHIFIRSYTAFAIAAYRYVTRTGRHRYGITGRNVFAYRDVTRTGLCGYILACIDVCAYRDVTHTGLHRYTAIFRIHLFADRNIARFRLHYHIFDYGYVLVQRDVALSTGLRVQRSPGCYVACHMQIAVPGNQVYIPARFYLAVLVDNDVFTVFTFDIFTVGSLQRNIAVLRGCLAVNDNLAVYCFQRHVFLRCHGLRIRTIAADMNIAIHSLYVHISIF